MWSYVTVNAASPEWLQSQGCVPLLFVLFRLVENEMTDDAAPHLADMIQANTGLTHLWWGQHSISLHPVYTAWSELLHSSVSFVSHCLLVCRLISNRFTVEGIRQLAEALAHNKALKEIWWASVQIDILVFYSPLKVMSDQAEGGWLFEVQLIPDTNLS